jgi:hypothetical protein
LTATTGQFIAIFTHTHTSNIYSIEKNPVP